MEKDEVVDCFVDKSRRRRSTVGVDIDRIHYLRGAVNMPSGRPGRGRVEGSKNGIAEHTPREHFEQE